MGPQSYIKAYFIYEDINFDEGSTENYNSQRIQEIEVYKNIENLIPAFYNNYELTFLLNDFISSDLICSSLDSKYNILIEYENNSTNSEENIELFSSDHSIILLILVLHQKINELKHFKMENYCAKAHLINSFGNLIKLLLNFRNG